MATHTQLLAMTGCDRALAERMDLIVQREAARRMPRRRRVASLLKAQIVLADWRRDNSDYRPHSALGMLTRTSSQHDNHNRHAHRNRTNNQGLSTIA